MHSRELIPVMTTFLENILDLGDGRNEAEHFATYGLKETAKDITSGFANAITTGLKEQLPNAIAKAASTGYINVDGWDRGRWMHADSEGRMSDGTFDRPSVISVVLEFKLPMKFILGHVQADVSAKDSDLRYDIKANGAVPMDDAMTFYDRRVKAFVAARLNQLIDGKIEGLLDEKIDRVYHENVDYSGVPEDADHHPVSIGSPAGIKDVDVDIDRNGLKITVTMIASEGFKSRYRRASADRSALIRLASRLPKGDEIRRVILSNL